jgi:hypothetical protein
MSLLEWLIAEGMPTSSSKSTIMPHSGWTPAWLGLSLQPLLVQIRVRSTYALTSSNLQPTCSRAEVESCRIEEVKAYVLRTLIWTSNGCNESPSHSGWTPAWLGLSLQPLLVQIRVRSTYALTSSMRVESCRIEEVKAYVLRTLIWTSNGCNESPSQAGVHRQDSTSAREHVGCRFA